MVNEAVSMEGSGCNGGGGGGVVVLGDGVKVVVEHHQGGVCDQGVQLRSSARVSKKLKLDSQAAAASTVTVKKAASDPEDKCVAANVSQQTSPVAAASVAGAPPPSSASSATLTSAGTVTSTPGAGSGTGAGTKGRRGNETSLWSMDDKNAFFESLNEFGKDFDAIHHHIEVKARKRGEQEPKSRDQVRHFYYRTWNKISKHLRFPDGTAKVTQELYGLVNYGEMRKKIGYPYTAKNSHKLKELIFLGSTQIRIKGKTWRIKTPICKALRKLNALEDCCEEVLPPRVTVELRPRDNRAWAHVQSLAYNPRVCADLSLHRRLASLIAHLQARWRHIDDKLRQTANTTTNSPTSTTATPSSINTEPSPVSDNVPEGSGGGAGGGVGGAGGGAGGGSGGVGAVGGGSGGVGGGGIGGGGGGGGTGGGGPLSPPPTNASTATPTSLNLAQLLAQTEDALELCVAPQQGAHMVDASFKMSAIATSAKLSFLSYTDRQGKDYGHILTELQASSKNSRQRAGALKRQRSDSSCEKRGGTAGGEGADIHAGDGGEHMELPDEINNADLFQTPDEMLANLADSPVKGGGGGGGGDEESPSDDVTAACESVAETRARIATHLLQRVKHGWTADNADATCIGELYVMFGQDSRLVLEYWWRKKGASCDSDSSPEQDPPKPPDPPSTPVTTALQKLLSLAKLSYSKTRLTCPCGHVCNQQPPSDTTAGHNMAAVTAGTNMAAAPTGTNMAAQRAAGVRGGVKGVQGVPAAPPMDGVFRRPTVLAPLRPKADTGDQFKFKAQLDKLKLMRFCNRRGRNSRSKNVVVPRILPLLPKVPPNKQLMLKLRPSNPPERGGVGLGGGGVGTQQPQVISFPPGVTSLDVTSLGVTSFTGVPVVNNLQLVMPLQLNQSSLSDDRQSSVTLDVANEMMAAPVDVMPNTKEDDLNKEEESMDIPKTIAIEDEPPPSPMGLLKEEMLINTDDYSLSSLLGHLESPDKNCAVTFGDEDARHIADVSCDDSRLPDVDAQLQSLMCEDSVDYMGKFADLAAKLTSDSLSHDND